MRGCGETGRWIEWMDGSKGWLGAEREEQVDREEIPRLEGGCRWRRLEGTKVLEFRVRGYI